MLIVALEIKKNVTGARSIVTMWTYSCDYIIHHN